MLGLNFTDDNYLAVEIFAEDLREDLERALAVLKNCINPDDNPYIPKQIIFLTHQIATLKWVQSLAEARRNGTGSN